MIITQDEVIFKSKKYLLKEFESTKGWHRAGYKLTWAQIWAKKIDVKSKLIYEHQTLWYLLNYVLEWNSVKIKDSACFGEILYWIDMTKMIISRFNPKRIELRMKDKIIYEIMRRTLKENGIELFLEKRIKLRRRNYYKEYLLLKGRIFLRSLLKRKIKISNNTSDVMVLSSDLFARENNESDYFFGDVIKELNKRKISNDVLVYDRLWYRASLKNILRKIKNYGATKSFIGQYYDKKVFSEINKVHLFLKKTGSALLDDKRFQSSFKYKGIDFFDLIENQFRFVFNAFSYEVGDCIAVTKSIIEKKTPKIVMIDQGNNFYGKGFMINSKNNECKIVALQYELVFPGCVATHIKENNNDKQNSLWRPIPDLTLIGGNYIEHVMHTHCNYPKTEKIKIVGQSRYDSYFELAKLMNKAKIRSLKEKIGLPLDKKIIVYAASRAEVEKKSLTPLLKIIKDNSNYFLYLKIKPSADEKIFEKEFDIKQKNVMISKDIDLKDLLPVANLLITRGSTVAMEAMIFDVPVILGAIEVKSPMPYVEYGSVLSANDQAELQKRIQQVFEDANIQKLLKKGRKRFLKAYLYLSDGKAAKRVVSEIENLRFL